jgi:GNAT superfamily N-acetyltransferase
MDGLTFRLARLDEVEPLNALIHRSAAHLSRGFYEPAEIESANRFVFGVDTSLVRDGTYFVGEVGGARVACGGWSRRGALYGGDQRPMDQAPVLDPATEPARIRAFFVDPAWARRGIGSRLLRHCERAAWAEGYRALELMATLPGVPLYANHGFVDVEPVADVMPDGVSIRFVRMRKPLTAPPSP